MEDWLSKEGIIFELSAPYSQEQDGVSERMGRTIMDMTQATILEGNLDDDLWPEVILTMTYVKNVRPTKALEGKTPHLAQNDNNPNIQHLQILGSTVYVFLHEEERTLKSEKWKPRALRGTLVGYDGHTIYRVYIKEQNKVIRIKDLRIFEDYETKVDTSLPDYQFTPTFQGLSLEDNNEDNLSGALPSTLELNALLPHAGRKINTGTADTPTPSTGRKVIELEDVIATPSTTAPLNTGQKVKDAPNADDSGNSIAKPGTGQKVKHTGDANKPISGDPSAPKAEKRSRSGRAIKPTEKAKDQNQELVAYLNKLLDLDWEQDSEDKANTFLTNIENDAPDDDDGGPYKILASKLFQANAQTRADYAIATQLDAEEPESYNKAMQCSHAPQWAQVMREELDSLHKNKTWILIPKDVMEAGHRPLGEKWVYKVNRNVEGKISRFKARLVIK